MLGLAALFDKRDGEVGSAAHAAFVAAISDPFYDTVPARAVVSRTGFPFLSRVRDPPKAGHHRNKRWGFDPWTAFRFYSASPPRAKKIAGFGTIYL